MKMNTRATCCGLLLAALWIPNASAQVAAPAAPLGVTCSAWRGGFTNVSERLATLQKEGFTLVSYVPSYSYVGRDKIDLTSGPTPDELAAAVETALRKGLEVIVKPHLNPPAYQPGFDGFTSDNDSWRAQCPWRGFFDVDPMSPGYRDGVVLQNLRALKGVFERLGDTRVPPVRFELGVELMNSVVEFPDRWEKLLGVARQEVRRLGLSGRVLLSHNFTHHVEILDDFVGRMDPRRRQALARYIKGLDALALSQYMDLTIAVPPAERGHRLPTADEVARALVLHEAAFRKNILEGALKLAPREVPPLHIGEFGVGRGGLKHPNLWGGSTTPEQEKALVREIVRGHEGLLRYLALPEGRTARSAVLWVTGTHYDIFGWGSPALAIPEAAAVIRTGLGRAR